MESRRGGSSVSTAASSSQPTSWQSTEIAATAVATHPSGTRSPPANADAKARATATRRPTSTSSSEHADAFTAATIALAMPSIPPADCAASASTGTSHSLQPSLSSARPTGLSSAIPAARRTANSTPGAATTYCTAVAAAAVAASYRTLATQSSVPAAITMGAATATDGATATSITAFSLRTSAAGSALSTSISA